MDSQNDEARTCVRNEHIGSVFQYRFLLPDFTALENVLLPMRKLKQFSDSDMRDRVASVLKDVGLGEKADRLATQLSGG